MDMTSLETTTVPKAQTMKRDDYKAIKHMDKAALTAYLSRVYLCGYEDGFKAGSAAVDDQRNK